MAEPFSVRKMFNLSPEGWYKAFGIGWRLFLVVIVIVIIIAGGVTIKNFFFPKPSQNIHQPSVVALPFSTIEQGAIDQRSTQILMEEKSWEAGVGGGVVTYDNKAGTMLGGWIKKKW